MFPQILKTSRGANWDMTVWKKFWALYCIYIFKKKKKNHPPPPIRVSGSRFFLLIYQRSVPTAQPPPHHSPSFSCPNVKEPVPSINRGARWDHGALWYITSLLLLLLVQHGVSDLEWTRVGKHVTKYPLDFPELWPSSGSETDHEG